MSSGDYDHKQIEARWQARWRSRRVGEVNLSDARDAYYMLVMFPYPSGDRLHVGHGRNYIMGDVLYRYLRDVTTPWGLAPSVIFSTTLNGFLFAAVHPQGWVAIPALMALAYAFLLLREWRGTLIPAIIVHGMSNGLVMLTLIALLNS